MSDLADLLERCGLDAVDVEATRVLVTAPFPRSRRVLEEVARLLSAASDKGGPIEVMDEIDDARALLAEVLK